MARLLLDRHAVDPRGDLILPDENGQDINQQKADNAHRPQLSPPCLSFLIRRRAHRDKGHVEKGAGLCSIAAVPLPCAGKHLAHSQHGSTLDFRTIGKMLRYESAGGRLLIVGGWCCCRRGSGHSRDGISGWCRRKRRGRRLAGARHGDICNRLLLAENAVQHFMSRLAGCWGRLQWRHIGCRMQKFRLHVTLGASFLTGRRTRGRRIQSVREGITAPCIHLPRSRRRGDRLCWHGCRRRSHRSLSTRSWCWRRCWCGTYHWGCGRHRHHGAASIRQRCRDDRAAFGALIAQTRHFWGHGKPGTATGTGELEQAFLQNVRGQ